ncbi:MAG: hypothetical protein JST39_09430, partial [Bacteroidetes bacterium]|nr:hypothetical protein [Bacteroidota bacterium]
GIVLDPSRDLVYTYSDALVTKGDHIRLHYVELSYGLSLPEAQRFRPREIRIYLTATNLGILWRANKYHIDPDYPNGYSEPLTISAGAKIIF